MRNLYMLLALGMIALTQTACTPPGGQTGADNGACIADANGACLPEVAAAQVGPSSEQVAATQNGVTKQHDAVQNQLAAVKGSGDTAVVETDPNAGAAQLPASVPPVVTAPATGLSASLSANNSPGKGAAVTPAGAVR